jgi:hypothetical protein
MRNARTSDTENKHAQPYIYYKGFVALQCGPIHIIHDIIFDQSRSSYGSEI